MGRSINTSSTNRHIDSKTKRSQSKYRHTMKFTGLIASTMILLVIVMASTASARSIAFPEPQNCCQAISAKCEACKAGVTVEEICRVREEDMAFDSLLGPLDGCPQNQPKPCCRAFTLECEACNAGVSEDEFCRTNPHSQVCPQNQPKPCCKAFTLECEACIAGVSEDEFCIMNPHSRVCPMKPSHPDNCYSTIWNTEIMHGEMGAKKCCWYGEWEHESKCEKNPQVTHPDNCYSTIWNKEVLHGEMGARKCCWLGDWKHKSKCNGGHNG